MRIIDRVNLLFTTCVKKLFIATICSTVSLDEPKSGAADNSSVR